MTSHLEAGRLQELLDGEIPSSELPPVQAHLAICTECRARLEEARAIGVEADRLIETIDLGETPVRVVPQVPRARPGAWIRNAAWAATLVIAAGTGYLARGNEAGSISLPIDPGARTASSPAPPLPSPLADKPVASGPPGDAPSTPLRQRPLESRRGAATAQAREDAERKEVPAGAAGGRRLAASLDSDAALAKKTAARDAAPVLNEVATTAGPESAALRPVEPSAPKAAPPAQPLNLRAQGASKSSVRRLDELVVAGASPPVEITFPEALKRLNGSLRLIEGLVPLRLEALGADVRVVYPLRSGELVLAERLENGKLTYRLVAPASFPADSLEKLRLRVRD